MFFSKIIGFLRLKALNKQLNSKLSKIGVRLNGKQVREQIYTVTDQFSKSYNRFRGAFFYCQISKKNVSINILQRCE